MSAGRNFDIVRRDISCKGKRCALYFVDGLVKDDTVQHVIDTLMQKDADVRDASDLLSLCSSYISYTEASVVSDYGDAASALLSGVAVLLCDGMDGCVCMDCRRYPCRNITEPENDKVLRGSRVGFVETLTDNTALIRRYIRDPRLVMSAHRVGKISKTDVIICYMDGVADKKYLKKLTEAVDGIKTGWKRRNR